MKALHMIAFILLVVGGLNWLLIGVINWEIGALFGGMDALVSRIIYILVGLAAVFELVTHKQNCKKCSSNSPSMPKSEMGGDGV
jgi:uncharacterized protein